MKASAESYRLMRWWSSDDTPEDCWVIEGLKSGVWLHASGYFATKDAAIDELERLQGMGVSRRFVSMIDMSRMRSLALDASDILN